MDASSYIALGGVIVAVFTFAYQSYLTRKQLKATFFADYTKRYQEIMLNLPVDINDDNFSYESLDDASLANTLKYMRVYFDLCSEEYFLSKTNQISKQVWKDWSSGIKYSFDKKAFREAWLKLNEDSRFYPEFTKWLDETVID